MNHPGVHSEDDAALYCASIGGNAAGRISEALDALGPRVSPSGRYRLGYTLNVPLMRYFRRADGGWRFDAAALGENLRTIDAVDRPVVVYLSMNHFADANRELCHELAADRRNLMWNRHGPLRPDDYFDNPVIAWTLTDHDAPVNVMRRRAFADAVGAIAALPAEARDRVVAVSLLGEVHDLFPGLAGGPSLGVEPADGTDYSPAAVRGFRGWLEARFRTLAALNQALAAHYPSFGAVDPPARDIRVGPAGGVLDHLDVYAAGKIPVFGWIHDRRGRALTVAVYLDGERAGTAYTGLNRTDVTDAVPAIADPNVGFRLDLDFRDLAAGAHALDVVVSAGGETEVQFERRTLVIGPGGLPAPVGGTRVRPLYADPNLSGNLDGPEPLCLAIHNPLARLWFDYKNHVVRGYVELFARMAADAGLPREKIFSHQMPPHLYGGWNSDLVATDGVQQPNALFNQGVTLYGGTAFGAAFLAMKDRLGWGRYGVSEMHPSVRLDRGRYVSMFEMHRLNGAVFVAPYYLSMLPDTAPPGRGLNRFRIAPDNPCNGSDLYWQSIIDVMRR
jgi:hypothetical protein